MPAGRDTTRVEQRAYATLQDYARETKQDQHSVLVDYDVFVNVPKLDGKDLLRSSALYKASDLDFRLKPGSSRGRPWGGVADDHGRVHRAGPDLGALEVGQPVPIYRSAISIGAKRRLRYPEPLATVPLALR